MKNNLAFVEAGEGLPIILLHGFCESKEIWEPIISDIAEAGRVIAIDLPGFGNNQPLKAPVTIPQMAEEVYQLLQYLNLDGGVIVGHSMGGYVALALAEKYPAIIKGLSLFHSTSFPDTAEKMGNRNKTVEFLENNGIAPFIDNFVPSLFSEENQQVLKYKIAQVKNLGNKTPLTTAIEATKAMRDRKDRSYILKNAKFPIMFFAGRKDQAVPIESVIEQCQITEAPLTLHSHPQTAHMGMYECPGDSVAMITGFVRSID